MKNMLTGSSIRPPETIPGKRKKSTGCRVKNLPAVERKSTGCRLLLLGALVLGLLLILACTESALYVPTPTVTPIPSATATVRASATVPPGARYVVTADVLEVRAAPGESSVNVGYLKKGAEVRVYETQKTTLEMCREWGRIGDSLWVCVDRLQRAE